MAHFAVRVFADDDKPTVKVFARRQTAAGYATKKINEGAEFAELYECEADDVRRALAMLEHGECELIDRRSRRASPKEAADAEKARREEEVCRALGSTNAHRS